MNNYSNPYLQELHTIATSNNGKLISNEWKGAKQKYEFEFSDSRRFFISGDKLKSRGWPKNPDKFLKTDEDSFTELKNLVAEHGGKLLSEEWSGVHSVYNFEFSDGRAFNMSFKQMKASGWPKDPDVYFKHSNKLKKDDSDFLDDLREIAAKNNGKLISDEWKGNTEKYDFEYSDGRIFQMQAVNLKRLGWPKNLESFVKKSEELTRDDSFFIDKMDCIAVLRGGVSHAEEWKGVEELYEFTDASGNNFRCSYSKLLKGQWTPNRGLVSEPICRQAMNHLFNNEFVKTKKVLHKDVIQLNKTLELDGYCEELKIAFEYQGHPAHWDSNDKQYTKVSNYDLIKDTECKKLGIVLIQIPPLEDTNDKWSSLNILNHVLAAIEQKYKLLNKEMLVLNTENFVVDFGIIDHCNEMLYRLQEIARINGGKLLSDKWIGSLEKYEFSFSDGRKFERSGTNMMRKGWPVDPDSYLATDEDYLNRLRSLAESNNGKLISDKWVSSDSKYEFSFNDGRVFERSGSSMIQNGWPKNPDFYLAKDDDYLNRLRNIAKNNNGELISDKWEGVGSKYEFSFQDGRKFQMSSMQMLQTGWPKDPDSYLATDKDYLNRLRCLAESNNGKLISDKWIGSHAKYEFSFSNGRVFQCSGARIIQEGWPKDPDLYFKLSKSKNKI